MRTITVLVIRRANAHDHHFGNPQGALGELIDGGSTEFPLLQQFNQFSAAHMEVSRVE